MKILLLILSVMTFTVESKNSVSADGEWPYDFEVTYSNTYNKGQVRNGDVAVLSVTHLEGITVEKVEMAMHGNTSSGSGTVVVCVNGQSKQTTDVAWQMTDKQVAVLTEQQADVDALDITLTGTESSLYIESYTITWSSTVPRTVTLMSGKEVYQVMTEEYGMSGIQLPKPPDEGKWKFTGWSSKEFRTSREAPEILKSSVRFYPKEDCTLWAVYHDAPSPEMTYVENLANGDYLYVNKDSGKALKGVPSEGRMTSADANSNDPEQVYSISFTQALDTAYITHKKTNTPIGYNKDKLMDAIASPWLVYHAGEETIFYTIIKKKTYVLWLNILDSSHGGESTYAGLQDVVYLTSPMRLMPLQQDTEGDNYTCHPEDPMDVQLTPASTGEYIIPFGNYELILKDGHKQLRLR